MTTELYSDLVRPDLLELAYDEVRRSVAPVGSRPDVPDWISELSRDLIARTYELGAGDSAKRSLRDQTVQAALVLLLKPLFAPEDPRDQSPEVIAHWVSRAIERGFTRAYAETLILRPEAFPDEVLIEAVRRECGDAEVTALLGEILTAAPEASQRTLLVPLLAAVSWHIIDGLLQQARAIGFRDGIHHVETARFGASVIALVDSNSDFDWVLPATRRRLQGEVARLGLELSSLDEQLVELGRVDRLRFHGIEFHVSIRPGAKPQIQWKILEETAHPDPPPAEPVAPKVEARPPRQPKPVEETPPKEPSTPRESWLAPILTFLRGLLPARSVPQVAGATMGVGRRISAGVGGVRGVLRTPITLQSGAKLTGALLRFCGDHPILAGTGILTLCLVVCVIVWLQDTAANSPSERAVAGDVPGFVFGTYPLSGRSEPLSYWLYMPPSTGREKGPFPLIVALDSVTTRRAPLEGLGAAIRARARQDGEFEFPTLFPVDPKATWDEPDWVKGTLQELDYVVDHYRIDRKRIYLAGHGPGGGAACRMASAQPKRWAAVAALSPLKPQMTLQFPAEIPCWVSVVEGMNEKEAYAAELFVNDLRRRGGQVEYEGHLKAGGRGGWVQVFPGRELLDWFASKKRP
jgi:pimeloyl-ACP methyl ester carboxylesterase